LIAALYIFCVSYAIVSDLRELKIPNWVPIALVAGFGPHAVLSSSELDLPMRLGVTAVIFCIGFFLFYMNLLGGGDVKLLGAVSLWVGPAHIFEFVIIMSFIGVVLAAALIWLRPRLDADAALGRLKATQAVRWLREGVCPYGLAIGLAGLVLVPQIFG
jgi:prepilin peptidase CpaA